MNKKGAHEGIILLSLSVMLVCVYVFSVFMYDGIAREAESGVLSEIAASVQSFIDKNEAVAVFLGIGEAEESADTKNDVAKEAAEYIARYNGIYEAVK